LYLNFAGMTEDNSKAVIQAYVFPLVSWIWLGFWLLVSGTFICLLPSKTKVKRATVGRKGMAGEHATVQN
jgi:cytochrome c-type biogenesis protein CcmF